MRVRIWASILTIALVSSSCAWLEPGPEGEPPPASHVSRDLHSLPPQTPGKPIFDMVAYGIDAAILIAGAFAGYKAKGHVEKRKAKRAKKSEGGIS